MQKVTKNDIISDNILSINFFSIPVAALEDRISVESVRNWSITKDTILEYHFIKILQLLFNLLIPD